MRWQDINHPEIYHSTDWAPEILREGVIRGKTLAVQDSADYRPNDGEVGISVTRSFHFARLYATVIFALDWNAIRARYKTSPRAEGAYDPAHEHGDYRLEAEEFIHTERLPLDRFLRGIWMNEERRFDGDFAGIPLHPLFRGWVDY